MAPVLRTRKSLPPVTPTPVQRKPKPKSKRKPKPKSKRQPSARKHHVGKGDVGLRNRSADVPLVRSQSVHESSPLLTQPLLVSLMPDALATESGTSAGPPFIFHYNGLRVIGGTFEQRAAVITSALESNNSRDPKSNPAIGEGSTSYGGASLAGCKRPEEDVVLPE
ncbi:unnamed protein product [Tuber aestivum]|uniref:Uncharacterized protein n=1 Tax=Tuber aestivum TaxID=59557 RepID=A0A292Q8D5_9PEZI|nr:unnamed protein product [Tuber aestivum]